MFCLFIGLKCMWSMKSFDIFDTRPMFSDFLYFLGQYFSDELEIVKEERYFLAKPFGINSLNLCVYGEISLTIFVEMLYVWLREREFAVFILWFSMNDNYISWLDRFFEERSMKKYTFTRDMVLIDDKYFCELFLKTSLFLDDIYNSDFDGVFFLYIYISERIQDMRSVLDITWKKQE